MGNALSLLSMEPIIYLNPENFYKNNNMERITICQ